MLAVECSGYSTDVNDLRIVRRSRPSPGKGQVLVRIFYAGMNQIDYYVTSGKMRMSTWKVEFPFTPGFEFSGVVVDLGDDSKRFEIGDAVFGVNWDQGRPNSKGEHSIEPFAGCFAEYIAISEDKLSKKPKDLSFEAAASISMAGTVAFQCVHEIGYVNADTRVLIFGGATVIGLISVQIAKQAGAWVAVVCHSNSNRLMTSFGVDLIVNYDCDSPFVNPKCRGFDFILDVIGEANTMTRLKEIDGMVHTGSAYVNLSNPSVGLIAQAHPPFAFARFYLFSQNTSHQDHMGRLLEERKIDIPIHEVFSFDEEGIRFMFKTAAEKRHKGKLLLEIGSEQSMEFSRGT